MSYSSTSKVILKDLFCKNFFHYGIQKTVEIFVEFNHQFLNIFYMNCSILVFDSMSLNVEVSSFRARLHETRSERKPV